MIDQAWQLAGWLGAPILAAADFFWQSPLFANDSWSRFMNGVRIALTLGGALLLVYEVRARKLRAPVPERTRKRIAIAMSAMAFGAYFDFFNPNVRYPEYYHRHEYFHYYLGSKYHEELGYHRLYECAAAAEIDLGRGAEVNRRELRDLRVNLIKKNSNPEVQANIAACKPLFTPEKWDAFKKDVDWFYQVSRGGYWDNMQKDHGYNPPPVWTMTGKFFSSFGHASDRFFKVLSSIDILFHLGSVAMLFWAFGWRVGAVATVFWGCNAPANFYWTGGAFMRMDWFFLLVASICLTRKRMFFLAGFALTWSALLRVFPLIFFAGWGIIIALYIVRRFRDWRLGKLNAPLETTKKRKASAPAAPGKLPGGILGLLHRDHRALIGGCIVAIGVLVPASILVTGAKSYEHFVGHTLTTHNNTPLTNHMGLQTILVHDWEGRMRFTRDDNLEDPFQGWKQGRLDRHKKLKPVHYGIVLLLGAWMVWALRRTKLLWVGQALSAPLVMSLANLTCYYYSMFICCAALAMVRWQLGTVVLLCSGASQILLLNYYWVDDKFTAQAWLFFVFGLVLLWGYSRPFSFTRLGAWWQGKPEPKSPGAGEAPKAAPAE
ncbi:MAG: hypothetical protein KF718_18325 [Polyangiaceae bacterium]|nr:hypothetical protein [Polyangiaceae bacterium]